MLVAVNETQLIAAALAGIALVLYLIIGVKLHAFVALLLGSLVIGVAAGMPLAAVLESVTSGAGSTLASIAVIIGLGAMFGRMLEVSGGARMLSAALIERFGERRAQWSLLVVGFVVAIPVFFDVAFIVLVSIVYGLCRRTGRPIVFYALPLLAGIAVAHAFIPPTPGPIAVAGLLGADLGRVMLFGTIVGLPAAIVAGPLYSWLISPKVPGGVPAYMESPDEDMSKLQARPLPRAGLIAALIALPLALIVGATLGSSLLPADSALQSVLTFSGHPVVALLLTTVLCFWLLGIRCGYTRDEVQTIATHALEPAGIVILVTGAGGVFKQVLIDSGVGAVFSDWLASSTLTPLLLAFAAAVMVRVIQGSATVAMLTAGGLVSAVLEQHQYSQSMLALLVVSIAAGATCASHVNDSGFWLVNRYLGLSVADTLRTWTATSTLIAVVSMILIGLLSRLVQ